MHRNAAELIELYSLNISSHEIHVLECSGITGAGLQEGLDWLAERIVSKQSFLSTTKKPTNKITNGGDLELDSESGVVQRE